MWLKLCAAAVSFHVFFCAPFSKTLNSSSSIFSGLVYLHVASKAALNHDLSKEFDLQQRLAASLEQPKKYIESLMAIHYGTLGPAFW